MIEIVFAFPEKANIVHCQFAAPCTVGEAIKQSNILTVTTDLTTVSVGIYGQQVALDKMITHGDRIEIYRPLKHDPKEIRRRRIEQKDTSYAKK